MKLKLLTAALALACAIPAQSQVLFEQVSSNPSGIASRFDGFDSALGTLTAVRFSGVISDHAFLEFFSPDGPFGSVSQPVTFTSSGTGTVQFAGGTPLVATSLAGTGYSTAPTGDANAVGAFDMLFTSGLERFLAGSSGVPLIASATTAHLAYDSGNMLLTTSQPGCSGGRNCLSAGPAFEGTFAFHYTPAAAVSSVPEPSNWAMMIIGFGSVGYLSRRRRRRALPVRSA